MTSSQTRQSVWIGLMLAAVTVAAYWGVWRCGFVNFDDQTYVFENPRVTAGLSLANVQWALTTGECANWHPLTWLSLMLDASLFGPGPRGFHAVNLGWHVMNVVLLFGVLRQFTGKMWRSACVAGLFAIHPVHVESVAWISERKDVLSVFFGLLALGAYGAFARTGRRRWYVGSIVSFGLSLMAKPMLVTLPCLLLLLDVWPLGRLKGSTPPSSEENPERPINQFGAARLIVEKLPFVLLTITSCVVTFQVQRAGGALNTDVALGDRLANAVLAYGWYLKMLFLPTDLAVFYPHPKTQLSWSAIAVSAAVLTIMTAVAVTLWKRVSFVATGWFWFLGTLVPVIGIIQVGMQQRADRYLYLPAIGIYVLVVWSAAIVVGRTNLLRRSAAVLMVMTLVWLGLRTQIQTRVWRDGITLWTNALRASDTDPKPQIQLARALHAAGELEQAKIHYEAALKLSSTSPQFHIDYGGLLLQQDQVATAIPHFRRALDIAPQNARAMGLLGLASWRNGDWESADTWLQQAVSQEPDWSRPYFWLGQLRLDQKREAEAVEYFRKAILLNPKSTSARKELARAEQLLRDHTDQSPAQGETN